ncbi:Molybdenum cofactor synthesis protein 3 [Geranomyces variabilis]|nr:Molybdenum cofactor synthesis protein 3 [Geranomyces variabilis]
MAHSADVLAELHTLRAENAALRARLASASAKSATSPKRVAPPPAHPPAAAPFTQQTRLSNEEISRFSRQLLVPEIGVQGQLKLRNASVLVVGAGGLGAPAVMYLAAAGIGRIGIIDYDVVEASNLQRQIIHDESRVGMLKSESAKQTVSKLSSMCECTAYNILLDSSNAMDVIKEWDYVVDATDNVATRYLLNDCCVLRNKPLISGSALRMDGQLTVYNLEGGPCYRCIFPKPPPPETVTNCSDGGVLGVVPGIIGCLQALEVVKIITGIGASLSQKLLIFDATAMSFRTIRLRGRSQSCAVCGPHPTITEPIDYVQFCGAGPDDKAHNISILPLESRISCHKYAELRLDAFPHVLLDVREKIQYNICSLHHSLNIPLSELPKRIPELTAAATFGEHHEPNLPIFVVCRRGNDSQLAVKMLQETHGFTHVKDIAGGLEAWARERDPTFPVY